MLTDVTASVASRQRSKTIHRTSFERNRSVCTLHENVQLLTAEFAVDLDRSLRWAKATVTCLCPVTDVFQLRIHWTEVQSCFLCELIHLFSVVFCVVRNVNELYLRLVLNQETTSYSDIDLCFLTASTYFSPDRRC